MITPRRVSSVGTKTPPKVPYPSRCDFARRILMSMGGGYAGGRTDGPPVGHSPTAIPYRGRLTLPSNPRGIDVRPRHALATLSVLLLIAAGCGPDEPDPQADPADQERIAELEASLADAQERIRDLEVDNENLEASLEAAREPDDDPEADPDDGTPPDDTTIDAAQERSAEGLIEQLRAKILQAQNDSFPDEWEPGTTEWEPFDVPSAVAGSSDSPGEVMIALAAETEAAGLGSEQWETTIRVLLDEDDPDLAYGAVLGWGFLDDSVIGRDVRVTLTQTDDGQWEPGGAEQRFHCMRGVTDDGDLCL